jgi:outer membrane protein OmpA-like peptidoglycan-associated protein
VSARRTLALAAALTWLGSAALSAQDYKPDDPVPPGAQGKVSTVSGKVTEIKGLAAGVSGKVSPLDAALKDLGARVTEQEITIELAADVLFAFDKADLSPEAGPALDKVATIVKAYPTAAVRIEGHTDSVGNDAYNQRLSERRAASVRSWLVGHGVANPMTTDGWGKRKPVAPNTTQDGKDDPAGRQKNRRVEITVKRG